jgi:demethylmenaquinone methyltransferase/2-methoxy-6-polyprenyl-1,4-benzoquinol methylase
MAQSLQDRKKESYKIFDEIAGTYDFLNHFLSCGIDIYWRQKFLKNLPNKSEIIALDLATGTGDVPIVLVKDKRVKKVTGIDLSKGMINVGKKKIEKAGLTNQITLQLGDGVNIPAADESVDLVTISFGIRNFENPQKSIHEIYRVLKPGGKLKIMELSVPSNALVRMLYLFFFRKVLPIIGNLFSKHKDAYSYLNQSVEDFPCGNEFKILVDNAGFKNTSYEELTFGIATLYCGDKS